MAKHRWKIGELTVTVEAPEGMDVRGAMVSVYPQDRAAFLAAADKLGGVAAFHLPTVDRGYSMPATTYAQREDGTPDSSTGVLLYEPPREREAVSEPPHPFFGPLRERVQRERSPTASSEETRGTGAVGAGEEFPPVEASS